LTASDDEYFLTLLAARKMEEALTLKRVNQELYDHLCESIRWLVSYAERNHIDLRNKSQLIDVVEKAHTIIDKFALPSHERKRFDESHGEVPPPLLALDEDSSTISRGFFRGLARGPGRGLDEA
jgi:hypothetical protein